MAKYHGFSWYEVTKEDQDAIMAATMLRIPVCMHNVLAEDIFRQKAWDAFGMDKEAADYRACATYGPMYK